MKESIRLSSPDLLSFRTTVAGTAVFAVFWSAPVADSQLSDKLGPGIPSLPGAFAPGSGGHQFLAFTIQVLSSAVAHLSFIILSGTRLPVSQELPVAI